MAINCYLAMTAAEFACAEQLPRHAAWMACHFSCYGTGLCNLPRALPEGSMIIVNDRTPVSGHDPELICQQLLELCEKMQPDGVLLDFQRQGEAQTARIVRAVTQQLPCPVGVSEFYARELDCPVFLPPPPLHIPLAEHLDPWSGRDIWLEAAVDSEIITVTPEESRFEPAIPDPLEEPAFEEPVLHCRYHIDVSQSAVVFTLVRDKDALTALLTEAEEKGIRRAVGLYQQLGLYTGSPED